MSRESEVAARLRADATLVAILTGGIYSSESLGLEGVTDPVTTPDAYAAGLLKPFALVRERVLVPTLQITDLKEQMADASQVVEVYAYELVSSGAIKASLQRVYVLLQGYALPAAYPAEWSGGLPVMPEPQLTGVMVARIEFLIRSVRKPIAV